MISYAVTVVILFGGLPPPDAVGTVLALFALVLVVAAAAGPLLVWLSLIALVTLRWPGSAALHEPIEAVLLPSELVLRTPQMETRMRWAAISKVSEGRRAYRLHLRARRSVVLIPKRAMPEAVGAAELGNHLRRLVSAGMVPRATTTP